MIRWADEPYRDLVTIGDYLEQALELIAPKEAISTADFEMERVDIQLDTSKGLEVSREIGQLGKVIVAQDDLHIDESLVTDNIVVRIAQVDYVVRPDRPVKCFPRPDSESTQRTMEQVAFAFQSPRRGTQDGDSEGTKPSNGQGDPDIVLLPELCIPQSEIGTVRDLVGQTGRAALAGHYWQALPPCYAPSVSTEIRNKWFVNEVELVIPVDHRGVGPTGVRWYRVRKSMPAHGENGLARALTRLGECKWRALAGKRNYRFVHPKWGDFTIAICSDLLDPKPWRSFRGELLHIFLVAFNRDVDLYESMTWVESLRCVCECGHCESWEVRRFLRVES